MFSWLTWHIVEMLFLRFPTLAACRLHCESFESLWLSHICWVPPSSILGIIKVVKWLKFNENRFLLNKCKLFLSLPIMGLKKDASMEDADHDKLLFWNFRDKIYILHTLCIVFAREVYIPSAKTLRPHWEREVQICRDQLAALKPDTTKGCLRDRLLYKRLLITNGLRGSICLKAKPPSAQFDWGRSQ